MNPLILKNMNYFAFMDKTVKTDRKVGKTSGWDIIKPIGWYFYGRKMYIERVKINVTRF